MGPYGKRSSTHGPYGKRSSTHGPYGKRSSIHGPYGKRSSVDEFHRKQAYPLGNPFDLGMDGKRSSIHGFFGKPLKRSSIQNYGRRSSLAEKNQKKSSIHRNYGK